MSSLVGAFASIVNLVLSNTGELNLQDHMTGPEQTEKKDKYTDHFNTGYIG